MLTFIQPPKRPNPYPETWKQLEDFRFKSALSLIRPVNAVLERMGEDGDYVLQHDLVAELAVDGTQHTIRVPRGMITDLTSVPPLGRIFVSRVGPWLEAAIVHDYLYIAWQDQEDGKPREADRRFADDVFLIAMEYSEVSRWRRKLIYVSVRWFGASSFRKRRDKRYVDLDGPTLKKRDASLAMFTVPLTY